MLFFACIYNISRCACCRYGFHGISYHHLTKAAAAMLGKEEAEVNLILCHLGELLGRGNEGSWRGIEGLNRDTHGLRIY